MNTGTDKSFGYSVEEEASEDMEFERKEKDGGKWGI